MLENIDFKQNLEPEPNQTRPELVVRKEKGLQPLHNSGLSWLLIVLVLVLLAFSASMLRQPVIPDKLENADTLLEPEPASTIRQPRVYSVSYRNGVFSPTNLRIHAGDTVRFKNESIFPIRVVTDPHPDHNSLVGFDSIGDIPQGSFFSFTFAARGIFGYHNEKDPDESATIIVR